MLHSVVFYMAFSYAGKFIKTSGHLSSAVAFGATIATSWAWPPLVPLSPADCTRRCPEPMVFDPILSYSYLRSMPRWRLQ